MFCVNTGEYAGFDENQPTSSSGGKAKVVEIIKDSRKKMVFIGDGVTDLETSPLVVRPNKKNKCVSGKGSDNSR